MLKRNLKFWSLVLLLQSIIRVTAAGPIAKSNGDSNRQAKAAEMLKYMNISADPCEDFYEFTCGNWNEYNSADLADEPSTGLLEILQGTLDEKITELLVTREETDTEIDKKVKDFYQSCLNLPALEKFYTQKLKELIGEFGQMPALAGDKWPENEFDWLQTIAEIAHKYGIGIITGAEVAVDLADNTVNRVYLNQQELALESKSVYLEESNADLIKGLVKVVGFRLVEFLDLEVNLALKTAKEIVDFETLLAKGFDDFESVAEFTEQLSLGSLEEVHHKYGKDIDFKKLIKLSLGSFPQLQIYYSDKYFKNLIDSLKVAPKRVVANYIYYNLISKFLVSIPENENELHENCLTDMKTYFSKNFDNMIYRKYNTRETEEGIQLMWEDIKSAFKDLLESEHYNWIKPETRKYAIEKLNAMKMEIVSYKEYNFTEAFGDLIVDSKDYVENLKYLHIQGAKQNREAINDPPEPLEFGEQLSTSPANILIENIVKVPVALLQSNFVWSASFANAFNFGVLGALLSHELIHGFDDTGRGHDIEGNVLDWWDEDSTANFNKRSKCFNEQYQSFIFQDKHLPEMTAQGENIADNGGVRLAYAAYLKWYENALKRDPKSVMESMPGLKFSDKKLFFISYGQLWCGDVNPIYRKYQESTDAHVPDKFRVIGPLSNFEEFSKEFQCPLGSGMNPTKKCEIY